MPRGGEVIGDGFEKEVEAALDRLRQGGEPRAPRRRAPAISSRVQELANSEMEIRAKAPPPAADDPDAEAELSWAYRQQLLRAMKRSSPLWAAAAGAAVGSAVTLLAVFAALALPVAGRPEAREPDVEAVRMPAPPPAPVPAVLPQGAPLRATDAVAAVARTEPKPSRVPAARPARTQEEDQSAVLDEGRVDAETEKELDAEYRAQARAGKPTVFVPPAIPGLPETLSEAEILQVVLAHKPEILACVRDRGGAAAPGKKRTLAMRWIILPDGRTSDVAVATAGLERSAVGGCLAGEIATWRFPPHGAPQPLIRFPFTY